MDEELELYDKVTLASGAEFACDYLSTIPIGFMFIALRTNDLASALPHFMNKNELARITYGEHVLERYTVFVSVTQEGPDSFKIALRKAFAGEE